MKRVGARVMTWLLDDLAIVGTFGRNATVVAFQPGLFDSLWLQTTWRQLTARRVLQEIIKAWWCLGVVPEYHLQHTHITHIWIPFTQFTFDYLTNPSTQHPNPTFIMQISYTFLLTALLATGIHAGCYNNKGEPWNSRQAPKAIDKACGRLAGSYAGQQSKEVEIKVPNQCYFFRLEHLKDGERHIGKAECKNGMLKEYTGCSHGGSTKYTNWGYTWVFALEWLHFPRRRWLWWLNFWIFEVPIPTEIVVCLGESNEISIDQQVSARRFVLKRAGQCELSGPVGISINLFRSGIFTSCLIAWWNREMDKIFQPFVEYLFELALIMYIRNTPSPLLTNSSRFSNASIFLSDIGRWKILFSTLVV